MFLVATIISEGGFTGAVSAIAKLKLMHFVWFTVSMVSSYGLGDVLFLWSSQGMGVPGALAIASCYPLWTTIAGVLFLGNHPTLLQVLGILLAVGGIVLVIITDQSRAQARSEYHASGGTQQSLVKAVLLALGTSVFWGLNSYSVFQIGRDVSPFVCNTFRMLLAMILAFSVRNLMVKAKDRSPIVIRPSQLRAQTLIFAAEAFGGSFFFAYGLAHSNLLLGTILTGFAPIISAPVAWIVGTEKPSLSRTIGIIFAVVGVILIGL